MARYDGCTYSTDGGEGGGLYGYCGCGSARITKENAHKSGYLQFLLSEGIPLPHRNRCTGPVCLNPYPPKTKTTKRKREILGAGSICASPIHAFRSSKNKSNPEK